MGIFAPGVRPATGRREVLDELPARRNQMTGPAVMTLLGAAVVVSALVVFERPAWAIALAIATVALLAAAVAGAELARRRGQLVDDFIEGTFRKLGASAPVRELARARRWSRLRGGHPRELFIRPSAVTDLTSPDLRAALVGQANKVFLPPVESERQRTLTYELEAPKGRRRRVARMTLTDVTPGSENDVRRRIRDVAPRLVGDGASATTSFDGEEPGKVTMKFVAHPRLTVDGYQREVERSLSAMLPGKWKADWNTESDLVTFERRPPLPAKKDNAAEPLPAGVSPRELYGTAPGEVPFAVDEYGQTLTWAPWINPMALITGGTGRGKTVLEHTLLSGIARRGWETRVVDGKAVEFLGFRDYPNVSVVASWVEEQVAAIHGFYDLMRDRYTAIVKGEAQEEDFDPIFLFIDEYRTFQEECTDWYQTVKTKGDPAKPPAFAKVAGIARLGRTARCHVVVGLQRPDAEFLTGEMRENFSMRMALGRVSPDQSQMMWSNQFTGVAMPAKTRGRGFAVNADGDPAEMLALWTPDPRRARSAEDLEILAQLRPSVNQFPRMQFTPVEWDGDRDGENGPSYGRYAKAPLVPFADDSADDAERIDAAVERQFERELAGADEPESDPFDGYQPEITIAARDVTPGVLVQLDAGEWGVLVGEPSSDVLNEDNVVLDLLHMETGEPDVLSLGAAERITVRIPADTTEGDEA